jgi:hypothetical protein
MAPAGVFDIVVTVAGGDRVVGISDSPMTVLN